MDDAQLLSAYVNTGSQTAFTELVLRHTRLVYACALRHAAGDAHGAQEIAQQVFTDLARKAPRLLRHPSLAGWLYTSTHYAAQQRARTHARRLQREQKAFLMHTAEPDPGEEDWSHVQPMLDRLLRKLSETDREAVLLRYFEDLSFPEIGRRLSLTENGARMRVERTLDKLQALLSRHGVKSAAAALTAALTLPALSATPAELAPALARIALTRAAAAASTGGFSVLLGSLPRWESLLWLSVSLTGAVALVLQARANADARAELSRLQAPVPRSAVGEPPIPRVTTTATPPAETSAAVAKADDFKLWRVQDRATFVANYAALLRQLHLDPQKKTALASLLLDRTVDEIRAGRNFAHLRDTKTTFADLPALRAVIAEAVRPVEAQIRALLGDELYARYTAYNAARPCRRQLDEIAAGYLGADPGLTESQCEQLAEFATRFNASSLTPLPEAALAEASARFSPKEVETLQQLQTVQQARRKILTTNADAVRRGVINPPPVLGIKLKQL